MRSLHFVFATEDDVEPSVIGFDRRACEDIVGLGSFCDDCHWESFLDDFYRRACMSGETSKNSEILLQPVKTRLCAPFKAGADLLSYLSRYRFENTRRRHTFS